MSYSDAQLQSAVERVIANDADIQEMILEAKRRKNRGFIANIVIDVARSVFGAVIGDIVRRVIDRLLNV